MPSYTNHPHAPLHDAARRLEKAADATSAEARQSQINEATHLIHAAQARMAVYYLAVRQVQP